MPLPLLLSVVGDDIAGDLLLRHWQSAVRAPHRCISRVAGASTPVVSILLDSGGEVPLLSPLAASVSPGRLPLEICRPDTSYIRKSRALLDLCQIQGSWLRVQGLNPRICSKP